MKDAFSELRVELEIVKEELETRLMREDSNMYNLEFSEEFMFDVRRAKEEEMKRKLLMYYVRNDLQDVERALMKMDLGVYGICEETGREIPLQRLRVLPTIRTVEEASAYYYHV